MGFWSWMLFTTQQYEIDEASWGIGSNKVKIRPNYDDVQMAYTLWVELCTRKIGMEIDPKNDVIVEIYDSWYDFFGLTREMIKNIPVNQIRKNMSTRYIVRISVNVLNNGLRPHLTQWQAKFRKWYNHQIDNVDNIEKTPQEIQQQYPQFSELLKDMQNVNSKMIGYKQMILEVALGENSGM
jgi:ABC-type long-subunit fatty acid transport system fused permease/ATPase subunit